MVDWINFVESSDEALELFEQIEDLTAKFFTLVKKEDPNFTIEHLKEELSFIPMSLERDQEDQKIAQDLGIDPKFVEDGKVIDCL
tara:strand:- start:351 stop:605 length:255 start_codon:yes stop_codon:yes gene_type:complete